MRESPFHITPSQSKIKTSVLSKNSLVFVKGLAFFTVGGDDVDTPRREKEDESDSRDREVDDGCRNATVVVTDIMAIMPMRIKDWKCILSWYQEVETSTELTE
jgi:hypothetical protein